MIHKLILKLIFSFNTIGVCNENTKNYHTICQQKTTWPNKYIKLQQEYTKSH